jgi:hypothetical protein
VWQRRRGGGRERERERERIFNYNVVGDDREGILDYSWLQTWSFRIGDEQILFLLKFNQEIVFRDQEILFGSDVFPQQLHFFFIAILFCSLEIGFV